MADSSKIKTDPTGLLFDHLDDVRAGMLGIAGSADQMQPMTHFADRDAQAIWFITHVDTDLVSTIGSGGTAVFTVVSPGQDVHASLSGPIQRLSDRAKLEDIWSPMVGAWFEGEDDPNVVLLKMTLGQAAIWASSDSTLKFGYEMLKANLSEEKRPDLGDHTVIDFPIAA